MSARRLSREDWLREALDVLSREGSLDRVDELAAALGVTKGSFYWHFKDREDFTASLVDYWQTTFTTRTVNELKSSALSAEDQLFTLMKILAEEKLGRYDVPVRAWAARYPELLAKLTATYQHRLHYIRDLFSELGFRGAELEMRVQTFVVYHSFDQALVPLIKLSHKARREILKRRHAFFIRK